MKINKILLLLVAISMLFSVGITAMANETAISMNDETTYADGHDSIKVLPEAEVSNLGAITVTDKNGNGDLNFGDSYYVYDLTTGKLKGSSKESFGLDVAMKFVAKDSKAEAEANAYAEYTTDFFIKIDGLSNNFVGNGCYLAGYYPSYGIWVKIPLDGFTVEKR